EQITKWEDRFVQATLGDGAMYMVSRNGAPKGKVVRAGLKDPKKIEWKEVVAEDPQYSIATDFFENQGVTPVGGGVFVLYQAGGPNELRAFSGAGKALGPVKLPPVCSVKEVAEGPGGKALVDVETFITPPAWYSLEAWSLEPKATALVQTTPAKLEA